MPALFSNGSAAPADNVSSLIIEADAPGVDATSPLCDILVAGHVLSATYDPARRQLVPTAVTVKFSDQPTESVNALVCYGNSSVGPAVATPEYVVLLAPQNGATILLPREGASNPSEVRLCPCREKDGSSVVAVNSVAFARGPDPYTALLAATHLLAAHTGEQHEDIQTYAMPLLDGVNRLRFDTPLVAAKSSGKLARSSSLTAALEQHLHEGILVQAGPGCPAKPLLQAPSLRICQGLAAQMGLRYSGMSVVYGTATGHVLALMDTAAALKMVPMGGLRALGSATLSGRVSGDIDSPAAVSAGVSAATSTTPSPALSRANSSSCEAAVMHAGASLSISPLAAAITPRSAAPVVLSGRSITAAPIIQVTTAASANATQLSTPTPTGVPTQVHASFALLGFKTAGGRVGAVQCCRIMPAGAALTAASGCDEPVSVSGLGLALQVEVAGGAAGTLLVFMEGSQVDSFADPSQGDLDREEEEEEEAGPVRRVIVRGQEARWRYSSNGGILSVALPSTTATTHEVLVLL